MTDTNPTIKVIGIISLSFSGSTVLNYTLGSHPGVYGASEIYALTSGEPWLSQKCSWCKEECTVLSEKNIEQLKEKTFYKDLARFSGKNRIIDSSKHYWWFEHVFNAQQHKGFCPYLILLTKHPLRHLASFMNNHPAHLRKSGFKSLLKRALLSPHTILSQDKMHLEHWLDVMQNFYDGLLSKPLFQRYPHQVIKYEDFVLDTEKTLAPALNFLDRKFDPESVHYSNYEQHGIGGNSGVLRQTISQDDWKKTCSHRPERQKYYTDCQGLKLDNRYQDTFSEAIIEWLTNQPKYQKLCKNLAYSLVI